ncbi:MAG: lipopolysaccharide transport periplasmic protein LptA [Candidatus Adiutrix sp.]
MRLLKYCFILCYLWAPTSIYAQANLGLGGDGRSPISISADHLEAHETMGFVVFSGLVVARQGDMTISGDVMRIFYVKDETTLPENTLAPTSNRPGADSRIERVECEGNVKIVDGDRMAVGEKAIYLVASEPRRIVLTGNARIWQGRDSLSGHQVTYFLDSGRSLVEGQRGSERRERVQTIYH